MNDGALRAVKKLYICLCAARDMPPQKGKETSPLSLAHAVQMGHLPLNINWEGGANRARCEK
jgi:hypothetical protein